MVAQARVVAVELMRSGQFGTYFESKPRRIYLEVRCERKRGKDDSQVFGLS